MLVRFGVVLIAWLAIISGLIGAAIGAFAILVGAILDVQAPAGPLNMQGLGGMALVVIGLTFAIIGIAQIIFGVGLWQFRGWAIRLGIGLEILTLIGSIIGLFTGAFTIPSLISTVVSSVILIVLLSPHVRKSVRQIRERKATTATLNSASTIQRP
ncbi:MAG TPA: hypothetical protein VF739_14450 [Ktedonobacterales bacterium]|jgi:uncharacterized membrane protein YfcA